MDYRPLVNEALRSNSRLKVGRDPEQRSLVAAENRHAREHRQYLARVKAEQDDRDRYIIPEYQDLEEMLTDPIT